MKTSTDKKVGWRGFALPWLPGERKRKEKYGVPFGGPTLGEAVADGFAKSLPLVAIGYQVKLIEIKCLCENCNGNGYVEKYIKGVVEKINCYNCKGKGIFEFGSDIAIVVPENVEILMKKMLKKS